MTTNRSHVWHDLQGPDDGSCRVARTQASDSGPVQGEVDLSLLDVGRPGETAGVDEKAQGRRRTRSTHTLRPGSWTGPGATTVFSGGAPVAYSVDSTIS